MPDPSDTGDLIELLYEAPGEPERWQEFLATLAARLSDDTVAVILSAPRAGHPGILFAHGVSASLGRSDYLAPGRPQPDEVRGLEVGRVFRLRPGPGHDRLLSSRLFGDILGPAGVKADAGIGVALECAPHGIATLALFLARKEWQPSREDVALVRALSGHMARAMRLHDRIVRTDASTSTLLGALDRLVMGVVLLDREGLVSFANRSAADLLGTEPGLADLAVLGTDRDVRTRRLRAWLGSEQGPPEGASVVPDPRTGRPCQVLAAPILPKTPLGESNERFALGVFIGDAGPEGGDRIQALRELYRLTPAESRLALHLVADRSLEEAAGELGITVGTARTTLKRVFAKTGTNRQASLVRLLLSGPAQLRVDD